MLVSRRTGAPVGLALTVLLVVTAVLAVAYFVVRGPDQVELTVRPQQAPLQPVVEKRDLPQGRTLLAGGEEGLWVARESGAGGRLVRFEPGTMKPQRQFALGIKPRGLAVGGGSVWVFGQPGSEHGLPELLRVSPKNGRVLSRLRFAAQSACVEARASECDPVVIGGGVWVSLEEQLTKVSLDGTHTEVAVSFPGRIWDVAPGAGSLWALAERGLYRIDPRTGDHTNIRLSGIGEGQQANHLAVSDTVIWISSFPTKRSALRIGRLTLVDPTGTTPRIVKSVIYPGAGSLALLHGGLWIDRFGGQGELDRVNATDGVLTGPIVTGLDDVTRLVPLGGELWAVTWDPTNRDRQLVRVQLKPVSEGAS